MLRTTGGAVIRLIAAVVGCGETGKYSFAEQRVGEGGLAGAERTEQRQR